MEFEITKICENVFDKQFSSGTVLGVYDKCFNVLNDKNELITIFKNIERVSTRAYVSDSTMLFGDVGIHDGMTVHKFDDCIVVGDCRFCIKNPIKIPTKRKKIFVESDINKNIEILNRSFDKYRVKSPIFDEENILNNKLKQGINAIKKNRVDGLDKLIGLGIGLTPSCDDFLSGVCAVFKLLGYDEEFDEDVAKYLEEYGDLKTTLVSKSLLLDINKGFINDDVFRLVRAVACDAKMIDDFTRNLVSYGSTSGTECVGGIIEGYKLYINRELI